MLKLSLLKHHQMTRKNTSQKHPLLTNKWVITIRRYFFVPAIVILIIVLLLQIFHANFFPISTVQVIDPANRVDQNALQALVSKDINKGFFQVDLKAIKEDVLTLPWVKNAEVVRKWPHNIQIKIQEREPLARWGNDSIIDKQGEVFTPKASTIPNGLPLFSGSTDSIDEIMSNYAKFNQILQSKNLHVKVVKVTDRMSWVITLDNMMKIELGREEILENLNRFVRVYDTIFASTHKKAQSVDMRYPNAMAVRWQKS